MLKGFLVHLSQLEIFQPLSPLCKTFYVAIYDIVFLYENKRVYETVQ